MAGRETRNRLLEGDAKWWGSRQWDPVQSMSELDESTRGSIRQKINRIQTESVNLATNWSDTQYYLVHVVPGRWEAWKTPKPRGFSMSLGILAGYRDPEDIAIIKAAVKVPWDTQLSSAIE